MSDFVLSTPAEFVPVLAVIGLVLAAVFTFAESFYAYSEEAKEEARTLGSELTYGMGYLAKNIAVIIAGCILAIIIPGMVYDFMAAEATEMGCYLIGAVTAIIVGIGGDSLASKFLECLRNKSKAKEALESSDE